MQQSFKPLFKVPKNNRTQFSSRWINRDKCEPVETYVDKWLDLGVTWIGGCCRTYAADVHRIRREVEKWKQNRAQPPITSNGQSAANP